MHERYVPKGSNGTARKRIVATIPGQREQRYPYVLIDTATGSPAAGVSSIELLVALVAMRLLCHDERHQLPCHCGVLSWFDHERRLWLPVLDDGFAARALLRGIEVAALRLLLPGEVLS